LLKPGIAAGIMGVFAFICSNILSGMFGDTSVLLLTILLSALLYLVLMLLLRGIYKEDILMLPKGEKIADILHL